MRIAIRAAILAIALSCGAGAQAPRSLIENGGFEDDWSKSWSIDPATFGRGLIYRSEVLHSSGKFSLRLLPNRYNVHIPGGPDLGVYQSLDVNLYRGKPLYVSAWLHAKAGATAVVRLVALSAEGILTFRELRQTSITSPGMVLHRDILDVPDDPNLILLFVTCVVRGTAGLATFDDIIVSDDPWATSWTMGQPDPGPPLSASVIIRTGEVLRRIPRTLYGMNLEWVQNAQGLWDENNDDLNPTILELSRALGSGIWRFPGGLFANYYDWRNGIGDRRARPITRPGPVSYLSSNAFGTDELLDFASRAGGEVMIIVNALTGTPADAAEWVRYVNAGGRHVLRWEIGNELYLEYPADASGPYVPGAPRIRITPKDYAAKIAEFAPVLRAADPGIQIGADIEYNYAASAFRLYPDWADVVLRDAAEHIDFLSLHNGFAPAINLDAGWDVRTVYSAMLAAPMLFKQALDDLSAKIDALAGQHASRIRLAVTEWGPLFDTDLNTRFVDHVKTLGSALYAASALKVALEQPRVDIACAFKLVDASTQGWIGLRDGKFVPKAPYYALQMFTQHFGSLLVKTSTYSPAYDTRTIGWAEAVRNVPYLEVVSSTDEDRGKLYLIAINKHFDRSIETGITLSGFEGRHAAVYTLAGTAVDANTGTKLLAPIAPQASAERFEQGGPDEIWVDHKEMAVEGSYLVYQFPPRSVTAMVIEGGPGGEDRDSGSEQ